jgi:hypothetical protein
MTIVELPQYDFKIGHQHKCMFIGSCFADNIGSRMQNSKINTLVNPTGIHYNPYSIAVTLETIMEQIFLKKEDIFHSNGIWSSYNFHSKFSGISQNETLNRINDSIKQAHEQLEDLDYLFITFGTSYVYFLKETGNIVSNCHKQPADIFSRKFQPPHEIVEVWNRVVERIHKINHKVKIIFTASPVRHWKDGAINNAYSKSSLLLSIKELLENKGFNNLYYFPAFEIVNDELRDYRFYADDMLHPSNVAVEYIWEKFTNVLFTEKTIEINKRVKRIIQATNHKPFNPESEEYINFCNKMITEIEQLESDYPYIDMTGEKEFFLNNINMH